MNPTFSIPATFVMFSDLTDKDRTALACWAHKVRTGDWPDTVYSLVKSSRKSPAGPPIAAFVMGERLVLSQAWLIADDLSVIGLDTAHIPDGYSCFLYSRYGF